MVASNMQQDKLDSEQLTPLNLLQTEPRCDYFDICGELLFMGRMKVKYHEKQRRMVLWWFLRVSLIYSLDELRLMFTCRQWLAFLYQTNLRLGELEVREKDRWEF
ncbi:hypothetical protein D5086_008725 [Populus alba]|uniref:Uncharacterized protein n=1 Tax=Populus alba TaxID=43335 RepID=A0ACC4CGR3_POPAL